MIPARIPYPSVLASLIFLACLGSCRDKHGEEGTTGQRVVQAKQSALTNDPDAPDKTPIATRSSTRPSTVTKLSAEETYARDKELIFSVPLAPEAAKDREDVWKALEYPEHGNLSFAQDDEAGRVLAKYEAADDTTRLLFGWLAMQRFYPPNRIIAMLGDGYRFSVVERKAVAMICKTLGTEPNRDSDGLHLTGMDNLCRAYLQAHASR